VPTASVNGIDVYYELTGDGPRLLFLNGSGSSIEEARGILAPFGPHFSLLVADQRGLGRTSVPDGPYRMRDYAEDAVGLLDHVGWRSCRVLGVSFGGMVAQELAVTVPDRVERLALACTSAGGSAGSSFALEEVAATAMPERLRQWQRLLDTRFDDEWLDSHPGDAALVRAVAARDAVTKPERQRQGEREQLRARRDHDVADRLGAVTCPTLVAAGRYDGIAPLANSEAIAARIPGATLRVYDGGHTFFAQDPRAFPDLVAFLEG
jgi:3-oxoadipate enol-lactonase